MIMQHSNTNRNITGDTQDPNISHRYILAELPLFSNDAGSAANLSSHDNFVACYCHSLWPFERIEDFQHVSNHCMDTQSWSAWLEISIVSFLSFSPDDLGLFAVWGSCWWLRVHQKISEHLKFLSMTPNTMILVLKVTHTPCLSLFASNVLMIPVYNLGIPSKCPQSPNLPLWIQLGAESSFHYKIHRVFGWLWSL